MTMQLNRKLNECAKTLNDGRLLAKLSAGDAIAQELKYHTTCLTGLYNKERGQMRALERQKRSQGILEQDAYPVAFSELVTYMVETKSNSEGPVVFRLAEIVILYTRRLEQLGIEAPQVNCTRLKEDLLAEVPELEAHRSGRDVLLAFKEDVGLALIQASDYSEANIVAKAAGILRRHMLDHKSTFDGTFHKGCIEEAFPASLLQFVGMVEHGADIKSQLRFGASKTDLAIAQILQYNCYARYKEGATTHRHLKDHETPFPVYIGMSIYAKTRKKKLVEMLHGHGLSILYDRVLEICAQLGDAAVNKYVEDHVVCPRGLRTGLFTTAAMDNIDHNPTATTATTSFHGTSISVFQHPTQDNKGEERQAITFGGEKIKRVPEPAFLFSSTQHRTIKVKNVKQSRLEEKRLREFLNFQIPSPPAFFKKKNPSPPQIQRIDTNTTQLRSQLKL